MFALRVSLLFHAFELAPKNLDICVQHMKIYLFSLNDEKRMNDRQGLKWLLGFQLWHARRTSADGIFKISYS